MRNIKGSKRKIKEIFTTYNQIYSTVRILNLIWL